MKKSWKQIAFPGFRLALGGERGVTLIETLIALAILGAVGVAFLSGLATSSKAVMVSQERVTAESLAKSQMEYIKNQDYDAENDPPRYDKLPDEDIPDTYYINDPDTDYIEAERLDPQEDGTDDDDGIQEITVEIYRNGDADPLFTVVSYKLNR